MHCTAEEVRMTGQGRASSMVQRWSATGCAFFRTDTSTMSSRCLQATVNGPQDARQLCLLLRSEQNGHMG
jgi:hypothetical protein